MKHDNELYNKIIMRYITAALGVVLLSACNNPELGTETQDAVKIEGRAIFDPSAGEVPFPNDVLMDTSDYTLNIPVADANDYSDPQVALNASWGFSTSTPISTTFSMALDAATVGPDTVKVYKVVTQQGVSLSVERQLVFGVDYIAMVSTLDSTGTTLVIVPLQPLDTASTYVVVITDGIKGTGGKIIGSDTTYLLAKNPNSLVDGSGQSTLGLTDEQAVALEPWRFITNANESVVSNFDSTVNVEDIILSWSFTTQPAGAVLGVTRTIAHAASVTTNINSTASASSPGGGANIHVGTINVPYYLEAPSADPTVVLRSFWKNSDGSFLTPASMFGDPASFATLTPVATSTQTIPLLLSIPAGTKPAGGWPVVIFQHGITSSRQSMLGVVDSLAAAGFSVVAIDLPLHGITTDEDDFGIRLATAAFDSNAAERHFSLDLVNNSTSAPGADTVEDSSGKHYINLGNLLVTRDNVRQSITDLFALTKALETMNYDGVGTNTDFDTSRVYFMGHSLGAMVGTPFIALETTVNDAVLAMPGGAIAKVLDGSLSFGPVIAAGLAAAGVDKGTADYESFMLAAQTVIDSVDPLNYRTLAKTGRGVLMIEAVGDQVIPNTVPSDPATLTVGSPLAGTTPLAMHMGLTQLSADASGTDLGVWVQYNNAHHSVVLTPNDDNGDPTFFAVYAEMQSQLATFLATDGSVFDVTDATNLVVAP